MPTGFNFLDFLNEAPELGYATYAQPFGQTSAQRRYWGGQYPDVYRQYQGALGQQILGGQDPTLQWRDWLKDYFAPGGPATQQWAAMSPWSRGEQMARFAPPVRWTPRMR